MSNNIGGEHLYCFQNGNILNQWFNTRPAVEQALVDGWSGSPEGAMAEALYLLEIKFEHLMLINNRSKEQKLGEESMSVLEIKILAGAESKQFLANLTAQLDRLEKLSIIGAQNSSAEETDAFEPATGKTVNKNQTAAASTASFDDAGDDFGDPDGAGDDDGFGEATAGADDAPVAAAPAKEKKPAAPKAKKLTTDDVNNAAKAKMAQLKSPIAKGGKGFDGVKARGSIENFLQKHFGTKSVSQITTQEDMAKAIKLLAV